MITFRKIRIAGDGKRSSRYYLQTSTPSSDISEFVADLTGGASQAMWWQDMAREFAGKLGVDPPQPPSEEGLARLLTGRTADTGEKWTRKKREIAAVDLQTAPHKSVTVAIILATAETERAALLQAVRQASDYAMRALAVPLGVARIGQAGSKGRIQGDVAWFSLLQFAARPTSELQIDSNNQITITKTIIPCDPQIHIHNIWFNLLFCNDGKLRALDLAQLRHIKEFGGIFQAKLADLLRALGVKVRPDSTECATVVDAVADALCELFSKGHRNTEVKALKYAREQGYDWEALPVRRRWKILQQAASRRISRQDGQGNLERWQAEAAAAGFQYTTCMTGAAPLALTREQRMEQAYDFLARHLAAELWAAPSIRMEVARYWAARSLIGVGIESPNDVNVIIAMLRDRGITVGAMSCNLVFPESWDNVSHICAVWILPDPWRPVQARGTKEGRSSVHDRSQYGHRRWLTALVNEVPGLFWRSAADGYWIWASAQWRDYTGLSERASRDHGWLDAVHPDDRATMLAAWQEAADCGHYEVICRLRCAADGTWRRFQSRAVVWRSPPAPGKSADHAAEWLGIFTDVDELMQQAEVTERRIVQPAEGAAN
jgi:PAS domain-containing protein